MAAIEGILYDNDGTLVDTHDLILESFRHATREVLGRQLPDETLMARVGTPLAQQMADFTDDPATQLELLRTYRVFNEERHDTRIRAFPGMLDAVHTLHEAGLHQGVVTSKMHALAQRGLDVCGFASYLECLIGADDCSKFKPHPAPVLLGCKSLGLHPCNCLYVGDSPFDIRSGNDAGCITVAVLWGMFSEDELRTEHPDYAIASPEELIGLVGA